MSVCQSVSRAFCLKNRIEEYFVFKIYSKNFFPPIKKRIRKEGLTTDSNDRPQSRKGIEI